MHVNGELKSKYAEHCFEKHAIVEDLLAVANIVIEKTIKNWKETCERGVLDLVDQVILVLWSVITGLGNFIRA